VLELGSLISQVSLGYVPQGIMLGRLELFVDIPFAFAQHHGIPTRYFDWTHDPFVAAYFAAEDSGGAKISKDICVWAVDSTEMPKVIEHHRCIGCVFHAVNMVLSMPRAASFCSVVARANNSSHGASSRTLQRKNISWIEAKQRSFESAYMAYIDIQEPT